MKILLTGAYGFVGNTLFKLFPEAIPLSRSKEGVDLRDYQTLHKFCSTQEPDVVVHLAAQSFVPQSFDNPLETYEINFLGTLNLLTALKNTNFKGRFLYIGSGDVYGNVDEDAFPIKEHSLLKPRNPYAVSKLAAEALCYQWSQTEHFEIVLARPFNQVGPGQSELFALSNFAKQIVEIKAGKRTSLEVGDLNVSRDFIDVRDAAHAYQTLIHRGNNGEVYNVCSGREIYLKEALNQLIHLSGLTHSSLNLLEDPNRVRKAQQKRIVGCFSKLQNLGWLPTIPFETTLIDILRDWETKIHGA